MNFELFVSLRYLLARRKQAFISIISLISILGVAMGVASLIVVLGVMNGFSQNLRDKILGVNAHVIVSSFQGGIANYYKLSRKISSLSEVKGITPFIYTEVMLSTPGGVKGVVLRGIDPDVAGQVLSLAQDMRKGKLEDLNNQGPFPGIIIGHELASRLGLVIGSKVNLLSPAGKKSAAGFSPKIEIFEVRGIFKTGMYEYDSSLAYTTISACQKLLGFKKDLVTGLEIRLRDVYKAEVIGQKIQELLGGYPFYVRNWMEMNQNLFSALKLEKTAMGVILIMIVLVGSFSIITTLVMLVMEKTKDIAIMMSMGATTAMIRRIFMFQGLIIGFIGTSLGYILGLSISLLLKKYQFIKLPADVYYLDHLPVLLEWSDMIVIGLVAMLLCFLATIYPARQAARLKPSEALRYE
ncbi:lipoprotein-releasing ABC transporter permease subunit [Desulfohalobiaceae bacterium Ax17]|uniref:lipoprotein-releasing ABC transporter permease subunit n=1 Tax=Desulfovulcanus ferrireducens TaxID=2831190 RepID=UPI00207BBF39|nr:lipoprotein-releasing ABC transporter permease subunit [Desulfovulcanus ferrireducens]MBT8763267.1 lipoprotein-releasing ABC transporter permease subunit [Desulfovulcanus ferrireducens]